jgi:gas vesicle protein
VDRVTIVQAGFAAAVVVVAVSFAAALRGRLGSKALGALTALVGIGAVAAWVSFALDPARSVAIAAAGLTAAAAIELALVRVHGSLARARRIDDEAARAELRLRELVERETTGHAAELERTLARARAESTSLLLDEERRIAEERRQAVATREEEAGANLSEALAQTQRRVERRLGEWGEDLERAQQGLAAQIARLAERQKELLGEVETRMRGDAERVEGEGEELKAMVARLRDELARAAQEAAAAASTELDSTQGERRRALHDLNERLRRRERGLREQVEREEAEAVRRIQASFADVERRQVEQLERSVARSASSYADAASLQFSDAIKGQREDAARRLARELDRGVQAYAREAERVLAERLSQVGDAGAQRLEKRLNGIAAGLERQREEFVESLERRLSDMESELRRRLQALVAETDSERETLESRLADLSRRLDEVASRSRESLGARTG